MSAPAVTDTTVLADNTSKETPNVIRQRRQPSLLDSLLVTADQNATEAGFGVLCNDPSGLCVSATGTFVSSNSTTTQLHQTMDDTAASGVYTSLTKLAQQLHPDADAAAAAPLITIESDDFNLLVKEYDGHAIALKVPAAATTGGADSTTPSGNAAGQGAASPGGASN